MGLFCRTQAKVDQFCLWKMMLCLSVNFPAVSLIKIIIYTGFYTYTNSSNIPQDNHISLLMKYLTVERWGRRGWLIQPDMLSLDHFIGTKWGFWKHTCNFKNPHVIILLKTFSRKCWSRNLVAKNIRTNVRGTTASNNDVCIWGFRKIWLNEKTNELEITACLFCSHESLRSFLGKKHAVREVGVWSQERALRTMDLGEMEEEERRI